MKNLFKTINTNRLFALLTVVAILFSGSAQAADNYLIKTNSFDAAIYVAKTGNLRVNVDSRKSASVTIIIKNADGEIQQEDLIRKRNHRFRISYDCSELEEGNYQIQISNGWDTEIRNFTIGSEVIPEIRLVKGAKKIEVI